MSWIKRNLYFVVGGTVAVVLLGLAGWYLYAKWSLNNENSTKLEAAYAELTRIAGLPQNPGNEKVNNIEIAKQQQGDVRKVINKAHNFFVPIPSVPPGTNVTSEAFAAALRRTVDELTRGAANASVTIQPKYDFSFAAERPLVKFAPGLDALAAELGEVKGICDVLFKAKVNTLYNLRRVRVSADDLSGPQSDYLESAPVTNDLAVLVPYEVTFFGFSSELAAVLAGFANEPHGFIVTTLNVEPGTPTSGPADAATMTIGEGAYAPQAGRYGYPVTYPGAYGTPPAAPATAPGTAGTAKGGLPVMLDEKQLKVTMGISVVKLLPKK
jgi:hypothetical protein